MKDLLLYLAVVVFCGVVFLPLHMVALRTRHGANVVMTLAITIVVSAVIGAAFGWWVLGGEFSSKGARLVACIAGGLTFLGCAGSYSLVGPISVDRSVSSHIVELVYLAPGHRIKEADLFRLYTHADVLGKRFRDCIETGIIERRGDELVVTPRGARIAWVYLTLGNLLGMRLWYLDRYRDGAESGQRTAVRRTPE